MAKDNLFLGMARGKVGDVVFSRLNGVQVSRARNRAPHNPQSPAQMVQRIIMSTAGKAYSFMQAICNHSFEGFETGQLSQRKFMEVNVGLLRDRCAGVLAYPVEETIRSSDAYNFSFKNDFAPVLNGYQISAGSLPTIPLVVQENVIYSTISFDPGQMTGIDITYADIVRLLGLQRGDQLTFIQCAHDGSKSGHDLDLLTGFRYARVILEPASGDMSTPFIQSGGPGDPNPRNEGSFASFVIKNEENEKGLRFILADIVSPQNNIYPDRQLCASAVILSRFADGRWRRSTQFLQPYMIGTTQLKNSSLALAYETYRLASASDQYLNQAE